MFYFCYNVHRHLLILDIKVRVMSTVSFFFSFMLVIRLIVLYLPACLPTCLPAVGCTYFESDFWISLLNSTRKIVILKIVIKKFYTLQATFRKLLRAIASRSRKRRRIAPLKVCTCVYVYVRQCACNRVVPSKRLNRNHLGAQLCLHLVSLVHLVSHDYA